jgi:hypothetical protein
MATIISTRLLEDCKPATAGSNSSFYSAMMLPKDFVPSPYSVIFGRGKKCTDACGNKRLRVIASMYIGRYAKAETKEEKSLIVTEIQATIQEACPERRAAFIKFDNGRWWEAESLLAREKIGGILRDSLAEKYRSSTQSKLAIRRQRKLAERRRSSMSSSSECSLASEASLLFESSSYNEDWTLLQHQVEQITPISTFGC